MFEAMEKNNTESRFYRTLPTMFDKLYYTHTASAREDSVYRARPSMVFPF